MSESPLRPAEANRIFYGENADSYEAHEYCTYGKRPQRHLREVLQLAIHSVSSPARVLDAGGGSGNASAHLLDLGLMPVLVDLSPEMAAIWRRKARARGYDAPIEISPLEPFFEGDGRSWDLIVLSSVLHHLDDPLAVLKAAGRRVAPGGAIATIFDPTPATVSRSLIRQLDYLLWLLLHSPRHLLAVVARRLGMGQDDEQGGASNVGTLAERHAMSGIDDDRLVAAMRAEGFEVLLHDRTSDVRRYALSRGVARLTRTATDFSLILRRPGQAR